MKLENAKNLYLEGIRDGQPRAAIGKYAGARYTQHSTGVPDGQAGFIEFFDAFLERNPLRDIRILRGFVDGDFVFLHVYQNVGTADARAEWITADIFETDAQDRMIEHWDIIQAYPQPAAGEPSMIDGPTTPVDLHLTAANKQLVDELFAKVLLGGDGTLFEQYVDVGTCVEHAGSSPSLLLQADAANRYVKLHRLIGQGNFVATLTETLVDDKPGAHMDLFRIADNKIVEHWDVREEILPAAQWGNVGKF
ncbi:MAG: hypothetical protein AAF529_10700 [Pseudomonadota bacterium]